METKCIWEMKMGPLPVTETLNKQKAWVDIQDLRMAYKEMKVEYLAEMKSCVPLQPAFLKKELVEGLLELKGQ